MIALSLAGLTALLDATDRLGRFEGVASDLAFPRGKVDPSVAHGGHRRAGARRGRSGVAVASRATCRADPGPRRSRRQAHRVRYRVRVDGRRRRAARGSHQRRGQRRAGHHVVVPGRRLGRRSGGPAALDGAATDPGARRRRTGGRPFSGDTRSDRRRRARGPAGHRGRSAAGVPRARAGRHGAVDGHIGRPDPAPTLGRAGRRPSGPDQRQLRDAGELSTRAARRSSSTGPVYSAADVLSGELPDGALQDKVVFVGVTDVSLGDRLLTPVAKGSGLPGVLVHASAYDTMASRAYLQPASTLELAAWVFAMTLVIALAVQFLPASVAGVVARGDLGRLPRARVPPGRHRHHHGLRAAHPCRGARRAALRWCRAT